jgi:PAS domain S-box-containing protein
MAKRDEYLKSKLCPTPAQFPKHKQADNVLQELEEHYTALIECLTDAVFIFKGGVVTWCNDKAEEIYGYPKKELLGKHASFFYPRDVCSSEFTKSISTSLREQGLYRGTAKLKRKDEKLVYIEFSLSLIAAKKPVEILAVARDITERKQAEDTLKDSEERYRALVETAGKAGEGIFIMQNNNDHEGAIVFANDEFARMLGFQNEELLSKTIWNLVTPDAVPKLQEQYRKRQRGEKVPIRYEVNFIRKNNSMMPTEISVGTMTWQGKIATVAYVRELTDRKKEEREREQLFSALAERTKELEQIIHVSSHDLRSPLVNIQGFTRELEHAFKQVYDVLNSQAVSSAVRKQLAPILDEDIFYALQHILVSSSKMDSLLSGLLRLSRLGRAALNIKQLDMNNLMSEVVASFKFQVKEMDATLEVEELPPCMGDETQINQVFSNLLDNALKFLDLSRPGIIKISGNEEKNQVIYGVEDNGIGIGEKDKEAIFEIFRRLNPGDKPGEGLGLTIVRKILDRHGGKIWVESEPGKGSKFLVALPASETEGT